MTDKPLDIGAIEARCEACPICGAQHLKKWNDSLYSAAWKCGRLVIGGELKPTRACPHAEPTIDTLRSELAKHDDTAKLLAAYAEQHGQSWRDADERKGLHARPSSTSGDVILKLVELGEMELIHNDNAWGICAVWTEEA